MTIQVRLFAIARQLAGHETIAVDLPDDATVADLRNALGQTVPELRSLLPGVLFSVDRQYAQESTVLSPNMEVACIPPVSGG